MTLASGPREKRPSHSRKRSRDDIEKIEKLGKWDLSPDNEESEHLRSSFFSRILQYQLIEQIVEQTKHYYMSGKRKSKIVERSCAPFEKALRNLHKLVQKEPFSTMYSPLLVKMDEFWCRQLDRIEKTLMYSYFFQTQSAEPPTFSTASPKSSQMFFTLTTRLFSMLTLPKTSKRKKHKNCEEVISIPPTKPLSFRPQYVETAEIFIQIADGIKHINQYALLKTIGRGEYAKVKLAQNISNGRYFAVKIFDRHKLSKKRFIGHGLKKGVALENISREIHILKLCYHENITNLVEIIDDHQNNKFFVVLEHASCGAIMDSDNFPLRNFVPFDSSKLRKYVMNIIDGLAYLHELGIVHRDLKPSNLMVTENDTIKIGDFGVSLMLEPGQEFIPKQSVGTPAFLAPELCDADEGIVNARALDVWALGVTIYILYFGEPPFWADNPVQLYEVIRTEPLTFPSPVLNSDLKDLLLQMMNKNPMERISIPQIKQHSWFTKQDQRICISIKPAGNISLYHSNLWVDISVQEE